MRDNGAAADHGFSLVEMLVVIAILGILATVTTLAVRGVSDSGSDSVCAADRRTLTAAVEVYMYKNDRTTVQGVDDAARMATLVDEGLLKNPSVNFTVASNGTLAGLRDCAGG